MKFVYFGTSEFAVPPLQAIAEHVCLVVSQPDRPSGRGMKITPSPVKRVAVELGIEVQTPDKARDPEFVEFIRGLEVDALIVAAYGQILSVNLLESAKHGGINLHGSILPKYRGAAPIQRALEAGDTETGVTLMQMAKGMDTGDIIDIDLVDIGADETYGELQTRLSQVAALQIAEWIERISTGNYPREVQDHEHATHAAKIDRNETELSFFQPVVAQYNRFRAFTPSPNAFVRTPFGRLKIVEARRSSLLGSAGEIVDLQPLTVAFEEGSIQFLTVQPEGKPKMTGEAWANGLRLRAGDFLNHGTE
jgi:methionyl-tRNA formyltransferase